jgi:hypothetical protein
MIAEATNYYTIVSQLTEDAEVIFHGATWEEYEELLDTRRETIRFTLRSARLKSGVMTNGQ